jgi:hypothetical protein
MIDLLDTLFKSLFSASCSAETSHYPLFTAYCTWARTHPGANRKASTGTYAPQPTCSSFDGGWRLHLQACIRGLRCGVMSRYKATWRSLHWPAFVRTTRFLFAKKHNPPANAVRVLTVRMRQRLASNGRSRRATRGRISYNRGLR